MKCRFVSRERVGDSAPPEWGHADHRGRRWFEVGDEIEFPDAWKLCVYGFAEPVDDECREAFEAFRKREPNSIGVVKRVNDRIMQRRREYLAKREAEADEADEDLDPDDWDDDE